MIPHIFDFNFEGKRLLLRCDFNVPLKVDNEGVLRITDDGRIRASLPTIRYLLEGGATLIVIAHLGRPKSEDREKLSLAPIAKRLSELLEMEVLFVADVVGDIARKAVANLKPGALLLLENIRFEAGETSKDPLERMELARQLAQFGDFYVGDGFGAVHRKHASVYELASLLPHAAGILIAGELTILEKLTKDPARPYTVVLGGAKVSDKIGVINNLLDKVNRLAIGGGMAFSFLAAEGKEIGQSLFENESLPIVKNILSRAADLGVEILLPTDVVVAPKFANESPSIVSVDSIPIDQMGLDIGPESSMRFAQAIEESQTVFWNGPMGVFEMSHFSSGTKIVAQALTKVDGLAVVGGGDSAAAVRSLGFTDSQFGYISTGGGAALEFLEGKVLPGLEALQ